MIARSLFVGSKKLRVFDFDDTLVKTDSFIYITHANGKKSKLTPGQYAVYKERPGDRFNFSDFEQIKNPTEIKAITMVLKRMLDAGGADRHMYILTARGKAKPIQDYLKDVGFRGIEVVALGDSNPQKKSDWIEEKIDKFGFDDIYFIDDSKKNVDAVKKMLQRKDVKHKVQWMKHS